MTVTNKKRTEDLHDSATQTVPNPGDYPLRSLKSRAAARAMAEAQKEDGGVTVIHHLIAGDTLMLIAPICLASRTTGRRGRVAIMVPSRPSQSEERKCKPTIQPKSPRSCNG